jgi:hypothetical protein
MNELIWRHTQYENPRLHYLYRGNNCLGMVSRVKDGAYGVYQNQAMGVSSYSANTFLCMMPTLDEAKDFLQTIAGAQL